MISEYSRYLMMKTLVLSSEYTPFYHKVSCYMQRVKYLMMKTLVLSSQYTPFYHKFSCYMQRVKRLIARTRISSQYLFQCGNILPSLAEVCMFCQITMVLFFLVPEIDTVHLLNFLLIFSTAHLKMGLVLAKNLFASGTESSHIRC